MAVQKKAPVLVPKPNVVDAQWRFLDDDTLMLAFEVWKCEHDLSNTDEAVASMKSIHKELLRRGYCPDFTKHPSGETIKTILGIDNSYTIHP